MHIEKFDIEAARQRLQEVVDNSGKSMRSISIEAGVGRGYLHSILKEKKEPGISRLAAVCAVLGTTTSYILYGVNISPETEQVMSRLEKNPDKAESILNILSD